jgi:hypothetical protein
MTPHLTGEAREQAKKQDYARAEVHPLDWQDDFGPLKYTQFTEFVTHMQAIERASEDAAKEHALCVEFGYRDISHFRRVRTTFVKYWGKQDGARTLATFVWKEPEFSQALMGSMRIESEQGARAALARNPALAAPEEGLTMEQYGWVCSRLSGRQVDVADLQSILAQVGLDVPKWERVNKAWVARMTADATGTLHMLFTQAYTAGGASSGTPPGSAAVASPAASAQAPSAAEPMSLARYAEMGARMGVWGKQGREVNAMLLQTYQISAGDLANVGLYWHARFNADVRLLGEYTRLQERFEKQFAQPDPDADLVY